MNGPMMMLAMAPGGGTLAGAVSETTAIGFYLAYAVTAITLVVFLARTLYRNGQLFLEEAFDEPDLANAVNQLLVIGFYLLNLGYALLVYQLQPSYPSVTLAFNELVVKIGVLLLSLGVIHLVNMSVFWRIRGSRSRHQDRGFGAQLPPAAAFVPPPPPLPPVPMHRTAIAPVGADASAPANGGSGWAEAPAPGYNP